MPEFSNDNLSVPEIVFFSNQTVQTLMRYCILFLSGLSLFATVAGLCHFVFSTFPLALWRRAKTK